MVTLLQKTKFLNVSIKHTGAHKSSPYESTFCKFYWFWIEGNGLGFLRFFDFLYVPLCSKKLSVQCGLDCFNPMVERLAKMDGTQACRILTLCVSRSRLLLYTPPTKAFKIVTKACYVCSKECHLVSNSFLLSQKLPRIVYCISANSFLPSIVSPL